MIVSCMRSTAVACAFFVTLHGAGAATVREYRLPADTTVAPESEMRAITVSRDGTIAASLSTIGEPDRSRGARWLKGVRELFRPLDVRPNPQGPSPLEKHFENVVAAPGAVFATVGFGFSGAYSGDITQIQRWTSRGVARWKRPSCVSSGTEKDEQLYGADDTGRLALTMDVTGTSSFLVLNDDAGEYAPYAYVLESGRCLFLGRAVVDALRGRYAAGFRNYRDGHLSATNISGQHYVAVRWNGTKLAELGDGFALAVNASGLTVGASRLPGSFSGGLSVERQPILLEALAWDRSGKRIALTKEVVRSVAYDVADDGTIVGTLTAHDGKHYAFRWRAGRLDRLDDLPHPRGWRFESAYAIGSEGSIYGIATFHARASIFQWHE